VLINALSSPRPAGKEAARVRLGAAVQRPRRPAAALSATISQSEAEALAILGLEPGASRALIKRTYRQLAKLHHPDLGGDAAAFQRLDAAYRLLIAS